MVNHVVDCAWYVVYNLLLDQPLYCLCLVCDWFTQRPVLITIAVRVDEKFRALQLDNASTVADLLEIFPD